ncbi:hypothetical protein QTP88_028714 [Uroleucon formosanum]
MQNFLERNEVLYFDHVTEIKLYQREDKKLLYKIFLQSSSWKLGIYIPISTAEVQKNAEPSKTKHFRDNSRISKSIEYARAQPLFHNSTGTTINIFQQALILEGVFVGVIFANIQFIQRFSEELQDVKSAGCDGTFKTVPSTPKQLKKGSLLTLRVVCKNSFPMVYALLTSATEETYTAFFQIVCHLLPLNYGNLTIITDFERGLMNAVTMVFPESRQLYDTAAEKII